MALTAEQNAILQLLVERGQSYADLAALLGVDEGQVRNRARGALGELGGADPDRNVGLTDYLLGQADPIGRADVVRHLRDDPDDHRLASELAETLRATYPAAELPRLPGEARPARRPRQKPGGEESAGRGVSLSERQTRLVVILGAAAILLIAAVLGITGAFSGGEDEGVAATPGTPDGTETTASEPDDLLQRVKLTAPGGGDATGEAVFGLATGDQPYVDFTIRGLDPAPKDMTYVIWLLLTGEQGYPLSPIAVTPQGGFNDRFAIPSAVLPVVARVQFVDVSIAPVKEIRDVVSDAINNTALVLEKPGETVLVGEIPPASPAQGQAGGGPPQDGGG